MSTLLVDSGYPALPFVVNGHGIDANRSVTINSGSDLASGTVIAKKSGSSNYIAYVSGSGTAAGILYSAIDASAGDTLGAMFVHGVVRSGSLTGCDANAIAQLSDQILFV